VLHTLGIPYIPWTHLTYLGHLAGGLHRLAWLPGKSAWSQHMLTTAHSVAPGVRLLQVPTASMQRVTREGAPKAPKAPLMAPPAHPHPPHLIPGPAITSDTPRPRPLAGAGSSEPPPGPGAGASRAAEGAPAAAPGSARALSPPPPLPPPLTHTSAPVGGGGTSVFGQAGQASQAAAGLQGGPGAEAEVDESPYHPLKSSGHTASLVRLAALQAC
jgi:hypothetical protein